MFRRLVKPIDGWPDKVHVDLKDGRCLRLDLRDPTWRYLYFFGHRGEVDVDAALSRILRDRDVVLDIGANVGVTTTWFAGEVGARGTVHAFEPSSSAIALLRENVALNTDGGSAQTVLNQLALGDKIKDNVPFYSFKGMGSGMASLATRGRSDWESQPCKMVTLDSYLIENGVSQVDFVKCDAEGADLFVLKGGSKLLGSDTPPIWLIEVWQDNTRGFGYDAREILKEFKLRGYKSFYWITKGRLAPVDLSFYDSGMRPLAEDVLCVPDSRVERLSDLAMLM